MNKEKSEYRNGHTTATLLEKIREVTSVRLGVSLEETTPDAEIYDALGADSLDIVELIMELEEIFDTRIPDERSEEIKTVQQLADEIWHQLGNPASSSSTGQSCPEPPPPPTEIERRAREIEIRWSIELGKSLTTAQDLDRAIIAILLPEVRRRLACDLNVPIESVLISVLSAQ